MNKIDKIISRMGKKIQSAMEQNLEPAKIIISETLDYWLCNFFKDELSHYGKNEITWDGECLPTKIFKIFGLLVEVGIIDSKDEFIIVCKRREYGKN